MSELKIGPINAATPTPLGANGIFDEQSARRLCRRWIDLKLDGVFVLGSMGEGALLSDATRRAFLGTALEVCAGRLTIFAGAADLSYSRMRERALEYAAMGAPCIVLCAPPEVSPGRAADDVRRTADACPVPCAYYEVPDRTGIALTLNEILSVLAHPNIVALKDSTANPLISQGIAAEGLRPTGVTLLDGCEYRTAFSQALGYDGVLHGGGVLTGRRVRAIWDLARSGKLREAIALDRENSLFLASVYNRFSRPLQNTIGQKYALKLLGVLEQANVEVEQSLDDASRRRIAQALDADRQWLAPAQDLTEIPASSF
ncbi:MAG TPA: dihydrodipicolinate synthase family protein [Bryobacteraceae bacterium]|nr:dihydrodipicolinate synthase family protein [Bryobacteraceae bacterium]